MSQETMQELIDRAKSLGVEVGSEDSRMGILQKISSMEIPSKKQKNPGIETESTGESVEESDVDAETVEKKPRGKKK